MISVPISNTYLGIGIPLNFPYVPAPFFDSFVQMEKPTFEYIRKGNGGIAEMRNEIVETALQAGCSHLLMLDTDMIYPPNTLTKLLSCNLDVVGGLCFMRYPPFTPVLRVGEPGVYKNLDLEDYEEDSMIEVDATGTACIMFNMEVFKKIQSPWFSFDEHPNQLIGGVIGEDIGFCSKLRKTGYRIFVDTSVECGHIAHMNIDKKAYLFHKRLMKVKNKVEGGDV